MPTPSQHKKGKMPPPILVTPRHVPPELSPHGSDMISMKIGREGIKTSQWAPAKSQHQSFCTFSPE